jgi:hypothetical protein
MVSSATLFILYMVVILVIGLLLYGFIIDKPKQKIQIYNEVPPGQSFETHWWGYGWRPWWRRYGGVPGLGPGKPLPEPKIPKPLKPVNIPTAS